MKVLITGAAGFIGSQLAHRLWKDGAELMVPKITLCLRIMTLIPKFRK